MLAIFATRKHAKNYEFDVEFMNKILDCFYIEDFIGGESDLFKKLKLRFLDGHFHLRKWRTNDPKLRKIISDILILCNQKKFLEFCGKR